MKNFLSSALFFVWTINPSLAAPLNPPVPGFLAEWKEVQCYQADFNILKTFGQEPKENFLAVFDWKEDSKDFFLTRFKISRFDQVDLNMEEAYNGSAYALTDRSKEDALCKVGKKPPADIKCLELGICPLEPYRFLTRAAFQTPNIHPSPHFIHAHLKSGLPESANTQETLFEKNPALSFDLTGEKDTVYRVFLAIDSRQLLGWRCFSKNEQLNTELVVTQWKSYRSEAGTLRYPSGFVIRYFIGDKSPRLAYEYTCSMEMTGTWKDSGDMDFAVDPATTDYIYDMDQKVMMKVPR